MYVFVCAHRHVYFSLLTAVVIEILVEATFFNVNLQGSEIIPILDIEAI